MKIIRLASIVLIEEWVMIDLSKIHQGDRISVLQTIADQSIEYIEMELPIVTCPCGNKYPMDRLYKCLYCDIFFCKGCASNHFGEEWVMIDLRHPISSFIGYIMIYKSTFIGSYRSTFMISAIQGVTLLWKRKVGYM